MRVFLTQTNSSLIEVEVDRRIDITLTKITRTNNFIAFENPIANLIHTKNVRLDQFYIKFLIKTITMNLIWSSNFNAFQNEQKNRIPGSKVFEQPELYFFPQVSDIRKDEMHTYFID